MSDARRLADELRAAAAALQAAVQEGDEALVHELTARRTTCVDELVAFAARSGVDAEVERLVREVLAIDREVEAALGTRLDALRDELDRIGHARRVARRQQSADRVPRFVSRRA